MTKRSDFWIFSDIDGTLVEAPNPIPRRNLEALRRFTMEGGHFAVATGRPVESALQYVTELPVNAPCVIYNGAAIYDFSEKKLVYAKRLPETWRRYVEIIMRAFPDAGITLMSESLYLSVARWDVIQRYIVDADHVLPEKGSCQDAAGPLIKLIVVVEAGRIPALSKFLSDQGWPDVGLSQSSPNFIELLPKGADKGSGLREYSRIYGVPMERIVGIGDYYNDEAMLKTVGLPVTVENAPEDVKILCRYVTGPCMNGALADLVEYLEKISDS